MKYYYLIAGLPDISMDSTRVPCPLAQFREEYYPQLSADDRKLVDLLFLEQDNRNLLALLADRDAPVEDEGLYGADELRAMIRTVRDGDKWDARHPAYLRDFIGDWLGGTLGDALVQDTLAARYYTYAMEADNDMVKRWFAMNLDMNNMLAALTARKYGLDVATCVVGTGDVAEALRKGGARDFGLSGITELPFGAFLALMQPIHLAIGVVEGLITAAVLCFVLEARPELLRDVDTDEGAAEGRFSLKTTILLLAVIALVVGGGLSLLASSNPDGLEWALFGNAEEGYSENMGLDEEDYGVSSAVADKAGEIQEKTSFLPDYAFTGSDSPVGTTVSGIVGSALVACVAVLICLAGGFFRKKKNA